MAIRRLAIPLALVSLADLSGVRARRSGVAAQHVLKAVEAAGTPVGRGRRSRFLAGALLAAAVTPTLANVEEALQGMHAERFAKLDLDGNKLLTEAEYDAIFQGVTDQGAVLQHRSSFFEADVDGDECLSLREYVFSRFLASESVTQKILKDLAGDLPRDFVQSIDTMFLDLRKRFPGKVGQTHLREALSTVFDITQIADTDWEVMRVLFEVADIIPDGVLNVNELEFLYFMMREDLVKAALSRNPESGTGKEVAGLFAKCDKNKDGYIDQDEALDTIPKLFGDAEFEQAVYRDHVKDVFLWADKNKDGFIDGEEATDFLQAM